VYPTGQKPSAENCSRRPQAKVSTITHYESLSFRNHE
jgi:hypothetical protein